MSLAAIFAEQPKLPRLLEHALSGLPDLRVLDPASDLRGGYTLDDLKYFRAWPPWIVRDVDRDGRQDVVAVVVRPGPVGSAFGVIAVHARSPAQVQWVVPLGKDVINGIARGPGSDAVTPLFCIECDANGWFRWNGRSYEEGLYNAGERIAIGTDVKDEHLTLFALPSRNATPLYHPVPCTRAIVRRVAGSAEDRWYFVETDTSPRLRGWLPASFLVVENECGR